MDRYIIKPTDLIARILAYIAGAAMLLLVVVLVGNAIRSQMDSPFRATYEVVSALGVIVGALALADAQVHKSHVAIDVVMTRVGKRLQLIVGTIVTLASIVLFFYVARGLWAYATTQRMANSATDQLGIPVWMLITALFIGVLGLILALVGDLGRIWRSARDRSPEVNIW